MFDHQHSKSMAGAEEIRNQPKIEKVMPLLLQSEKDRNDYLPAAVSFGPHHHGDRKLAFVENFKPKAVELFASGSGEDKEFYYNKVVDIIDDLRSYYEEETVDQYTYVELAVMMLQDAALLIMYMEKVDALVGYIGMLTFEVLARDMVLLENQIPLRVIRVLVDARDGAAGRGDELIRRSITLMFFGKHVKEAVQHKFGDSPHLLDVIRRLHISGHGKSRGQEANRSIDLENGLGLRELLGCKSGGAAEDGSSKNLVPVYRAATDLRAKGIYFKPSSTQSLGDVTFKFRFLYARLRIPAFTVDKETKVLFKNMIAYELSPSSYSGSEIASFVDFIKSLIEKAGDVKELREKKILLNKLGSDQEVLDMLKDINTHGADSASVYEDVRDEIRAHCDSKMRTWIAELVHTHFESPWTAFTFLAAVVLLGVTVAQLYFAVYPN